VKDLENWVVGCDKDFGGMYCFFLRKEIEFYDKMSVLCRIFECEIGNKRRRIW
jgi:hypothetical protein